MQDPVKNLVGELGRYLSEKDHHDIVLNNGKGRQFEIIPSEFAEIPENSNPKKIAFVDGGDGPLEESPNYLITMNRIYFSIFQGKKRVKPKMQPRMQFFSCVISDVSLDKGEKKITYNTMLFTHNSEDKSLLPTESDLTSSTESSSILQGSRLNSLARRFAEWQLAIRVVENELESGDVLVMDGSLQTGFKNESKYANRLYELAKSKKVIVCGLAKTSRLITESGDPLLARISEISSGINFKKWYIRIAEEVSADDEGFMLVAKFHPKSNFVYRFEILREQFLEMNKEEIEAVLSSVAENSSDISMLGYPYGAIDADRFAQVRVNELGMYRGLMLAERLKNPEWKRLGKYSESVAAHDVLNGVTS